MSNESAIRRDVGAIALMFTGLGSIIGSGWLFGAWRAAQLAGPGAVYAWVIGAVVILFVAFTYAELGAMFPESGGSVRYGHYSHGTLVGFVAGWAAWIAIVSVIPVEAEASVQYMSSWPWAWAHALYVHAANGQGVLSVAGLSISAVLVVIYFLVNFWSVKVFADTNSAITFFKLIVPAATAVALMCSGFHAENFHVGVHGGRHVGDLAAILTAVATSGIVFSYNGFQSPVNLAGEARHPGRSVPFAIFGSIALSTVVYLMLQVAFLGSVAPEHLGEGWAALEYSSPFAQLALALNLNWLALRGCIRQPERHGQHLHRHDRSHDLRDGAQRHGPRSVRQGSPEIRHSPPGDVVQLARVFHFPVLLQRLGKARCGDFSGHHHYLPGGADQRHRAAAYGARFAPPAARARLARTRTHGVRARHVDVVLGALAAYRPDHAAVDSALAGVPVLSGQRQLARLRTTAARVVVAVCVSHRHHGFIVGGQQGVRRSRLHRLWLGSAVRRRHLTGLLFLGSAQRLAHPCGDRRRERCGRNGCGEVLSRKTLGLQQLLGLGRSRAQID
jgi:hypothetical protein